jgi:hypothetical protein
VGGGYRQAGLSDIALEFMIQQAVTEAGLTFLEPGDVDVVAASGGLVEPSDLRSRPDAAADDHTKGFEKFLKEFFDALGPRDVMVPGGGVPVLHESVVERGRIRPYRPKNLRNLRHTIWGEADKVYAD